MRWNPVLGAAIAAAALLLAAGAICARAGVTFEPLLRQRAVVCMAEADGVVAAGLDGGGLAVWPADDPAALHVWQAGDDLSGNYVRCLAWTGQHLWAGTTGAGLTRIADPGGAADFRQYAGNLSGLDITAVTGAVVGGAERVWYAVAGGGVGVISNGIAGAAYTAAADGLISDDIDAIAIHGDAVFFGCATGVSRFAGNVFTTVNTGLTSTHINALTTAPDGTLLAVGNGGLYAWDDGSSSWSLLGGTGWWLNAAAWVGEDLWVLGTAASGAGMLSRWDGAAFTSVAAPRPAAYGIAGGDRVWVGGRNRLATMGSASGFAWFASLGALGESFALTDLDEGPVVGDVVGVTFDHDGRAWIGSLVAQGISGYADDGWVNVFELATADNDSNGLINHSGNVLAMATTSDGAVWACQYGSGGLLRHDPQTGITEQVLTTNSGLHGRGIVALTAHPDGPLIVLHDWQDAVKAEVLVDPTRWRNPANWVALPSGSGGLGDGAGVWDAFVQRRDVIWFAVETTGLVRWDLNGDVLGPDDTLTWTDPSDDRWDAPIAEFPGLTNDPTRPVTSLAAGPSGTIWCGGDDLVLFYYDPIFRRVSVEDYLLVKQSPTVPGLLGGGVNDLAGGGDEDLWVLCLNGLNRVRRVDDGWEVDAWMDLMNYVGGIGYATMYSPGVIEPLPGMVYRKIVADPGSDRLLLAADRGAALVTPTTDSAPGGDPLAALHLNANPWLPEEDGPLALGGIGATTDDPAVVAIFTVEGQPLARISGVAAGEGFWGGRTRSGAPVASGLYVVQVTWRGVSAVRTLAVVR